MLQTVLQRFPIERVVLVADRGLLSLDKIGELTALADQGGRRLEFILAVPARRYGELVETFRDLAFDDEGLAEATFAGHRLIIAHDPFRATEQSDRRRTRIAERPWPRRWSPNSTHKTKVRWQRGAAPPTAAPSAGSPGPWPRPN
jgi:hypothetical protein